MLTLLSSPFMSRLRPNYLMWHENKAKNLLFVFLLLTAALFPPHVKAIPAFPNAEGFGSQTIGGRGGQVIKVTNLNDSGPGSLRAALTTSGPRIVVFTVGGTINLSSVITISNPYLTVAGQTAPGDGILIHGQYKPNAINAGNGDGTILVNTHDVVIRGLRIRGVNRSAIALYGESIYNVVIDHNSLSWSVDSIIDNWYSPHDVTYSWNIISEAVGAHNLGMLIGGYDECRDAGFNYSIHHNLFAHNSGRNPLIKNQIGSTEIINNVVYNYQWFGIDTMSTAAIIGNHIIPGNNSSAYNRGVIVRQNDACPYLQPSSVYAPHNLSIGRTTDTGDDWNAVEGDAKYRTNSAPFALSGINVDNVTDIKNIILEKVGATIPSRDSVDIRIINDVKNKTGGYINSPEEVGGWPTIKSASAQTDSDGDGLPDSWDTNGRSPSDIAPSGYTWIEEYINSFYFPSYSTTSPTPKLVVGDATGEGDVNLFDFSVIVNNYNKSTTNGFVDADFNLDQKVDGQDYILWLNNYK